MPLTWWTSKIKLSLCILTVDKLVAQSWVVFKDKSFLTLVSPGRWASTTSLLCLKETQTEVKFSSKCHEKSECHTRRYTASLQLLHHSKRLWTHKVLLCLTSRNFTSRESFTLEKHLTSSALYVTSRSLIFLHSFCWRKVHKKPVSPGDLV